MARSNKKQIKKQKIIFIANIQAHHEIFNQDIICKLAENNFDVVVVAKKEKKTIFDGRDKIKFINWNIDRGNKNIIKEFASLIDLAKIIQREKPDIIHNFTIKANIYGSITGRLFSGAKIYNTVTGLGYVYTDNKLSSLLLRLIIKSLWLFALNFSQLVMFMNKTDLETMGKFIFLPRKVVIPGHGVDTKEFSRAKVNKRYLDNIIADNPEIRKSIVITTVGRLIRHKGIYEFIEAARNILSKYPGLLFVIVGLTDSLNPSRISKTEISKINNERILFLYNRDDVREILSLSDIFVLASYREGAPQVIIEAMSMGLPIITTDVAGCNERVINGYNGFLVRHKDSKGIILAIEKLLQTPKLAKRMGHNSRKLVMKKYQRQMLTNKIVKFYE